MASNNASQAVKTSNFDVRLAGNRQPWAIGPASIVTPILTSIYQRYSIVDSFLGMNLEDFRHIWKGRFPFQGCAQISVSPHGA